jgi:hypothetical protein
MIIGSAVSFVLEFGCNSWFPRGFRTIGGLSCLTVSQGPPFSCSTVLEVAIQVSEDRDVTDPSEDRFDNMPLVLETIPRIRARVRVFAEILGRGTRDRSSSIVEQQ